MIYSDLAIPGFTLARMYEEVSSTMDVARQCMTELRGGHGLVCARRQSAGRGRQGREWRSSDGALMFTLLLHAEVPVSHFSGYSLVVGVGLIEALRELGAHLQLKWPNDLVVVERGRIEKIGGVLIEVQEAGDRRIMLVGVGLNLSSAPQDLPVASSLKEKAGRDFNSEQVLPLVAAHLKTTHERFIKSEGFVAFKDSWESCSCFEPGVTELTIDLGEHRAKGIYQGLDPSGAVLLRDGVENRTVPSGHVVSLLNLRERGGSKATWRA